MFYVRVKLTSGKQGDNGQSVKLHIRLTNSGDLMYSTV